MTVIYPDSRNTITVVGGNPVSGKPYSMGSVTGLTAYALPRGVMFMWDGMPFDNRVLFFKYRTKIGAGAWSGWVSTYQNQVTRFLSASEISAYGHTANIIIEVYAEDIYAAVSNTETTNADCRYLEGISEDIIDGEVEPADLSAASLARMFTTSDKYLDELTEHGTAYFAGESGADVTADHTSDDTSKVNSVAAATVQSNAQYGKDAWDWLNGDISGLTVESTTGAQTKVDNRLSSAQKTLMLAEKSLGGYILYTENNKPTKSDVGLANVSDYSPANQIVNGLTKAHITGSPVSLTPADISAINTDLSNAPTTVKNVTITISADGTLNNAGGGQVTKAGLGLGNVENYTAAQMVANGITLAHVTGTGITLDSIPDGVTYKRVTSALVASIKRMLFRDYDAIAAGGATRSNLKEYSENTTAYDDFIVFPYIKQHEDGDLILDAMFKNTADGYCKIEIRDYGDTVHAYTEETIPNTGNAWTQDQVIVDVTGLTNDTLYLVWVRLKAASSDTQYMRGVSMYVTPS